MSAEQTPLFVYLTEAMIIEETVAMHQQRLQKHNREAAASKPCFEPLEAPELYACKPEPLKWYVPVLCIGPLAFFALALLWTAVFELRTMRSVLGGLLMLLPLALIVMVPMGIEWIGHMRAALRYSRQCAQYEHELEKVRAANERHRQEYALDVREWEDAAAQKREFLEQDLNAALDRRREFYEADGRLYEKYRSITCIRLLLDYFASGRRSELTGPNGAYDLLEEDLFRTDLAATLHQFQSDVSRDLAALYKLCYDAATSERTIRTTTTVSFS